MNDQVEAARRWAKFYRELGYQPLPSSATDKKPMLSTFAEFWELPLPRTILDSWHAPNIQLMTGAYWRLLVVDCDGPRAHEIWQALCASHAHDPRTWVVQTGSGDWHYYYALRASVEDFRTRRIWGIWDPMGGPRKDGAWLADHEIRLLGDRNLVVAPPSLHVKTGKPYEFLADHDPVTITAPLAAPQWLLEMPELDKPRFTPPPNRTDRKLSGRSGRGGVLPERNAVLEALGSQKHLIAEQYGLRLASRQPNQDGWVTCHAIDREDVHPSASIHSEAGIYFDFVSREVMSFFDLIATLSPGRLDWRDALCDLASRTHVEAPRAQEFRRSI